MSEPTLEAAAQFRHIEVHRQPGGIGASVSAPPLDAAPPAAVFEEIACAWAAHGVLAIGGQQLTPATLEAVSARLGEFGPDPFVRPLDGHYHVIEVRRDATETAPIFGSNWHSDWSFQARPPVATLLYAAQVPPVGGDTLFADTECALAALSPTLRHLLRQLECVHSATRAYGPRGLFARDDDSRSMRIVVSRDADRETTHPMMLDLDARGREALYVNHVYTLRVAGMNLEESRALLDFLFRHLTQARFVYRHRWSAETLLLWDNRRMIHAAQGGYDGHCRLLWRTTLATLGGHAFPHPPKNLTS